MADIFRPAGPPASLLGQKFRVQRWEPDGNPTIVPAHHYIKWPLRRPLVFWILASRKR